MPIEGCKAGKTESRVGQGVTKPNPSRKSLERAIVEGDNPVDERGEAPYLFLSTTGHEESCGKLP